MSVICHHGILGQKWGIRRYQNYDGTLTEEGRRRLGLSTKKDKFISNYDDSETYKMATYERVVNEAIDFLSQEDLRVAFNNAKGPFNGLFTGYDTWVDALSEVVNDSDNFDDVMESLISKGYDLVELKPGAKPTILSDKVEKGLSLSSKLEKENTNIKNFTSYHKEMIKDIDNPEVIKNIEAHIDLAESTIRNNNTLLKAIDEGTLQYGKDYAYVLNKSGKFDVSLSTLYSDLANSSVLNTYMYNDWALNYEE